MIQSFIHSLKLPSQNCTLSYIVRCSGGAGPGYKCFCCIVSYVGSCNIDLKCQSLIPRTLYYMHILSGKTRKWHSGFTNVSFLVAKLLQSAVQGHCQFSSVFSKGFYKFSVEELHMYSVLRGETIRKCVRTVHEKQAQDISLLLP